MRQIQTEFVYPPIPVRCFDWVAYFTDFGEDSPQGTGATEAEAIANLLDEMDGE